MIIRHHLAVRRRALAAGFAQAALKVALLTRNCGFAALVMLVRCAQTCGGDAAAEAILGQ